MMTFTCSQCGGTFEYAWSDEEANAEAQNNWGVTDASKRHDMAVVCDDCHTAFMRWFNDLMSGFSRVGR